MSFTVLILIWGVTSEAIFSLDLAFSIIASVFKDNLSSPYLIIAEALLFIILFNTSFIFYPLSAEFNLYVWYVSSCFNRSLSYFSLSLSNLAF